MHGSTLELNSFGWIRLRGIRIEDVLIGVYPHEHAAPQAIVVDAALWVATRQAASSDSLTDTVDYAQCVSDLINTARKRHYMLLETLAETLAACLLARGVTRVHVEVHKPAGLSNGQVSVAVERGP